MMLKRNLLLVAVTIAIITVLGQAWKGNFVDLGMNEINSLDDLRGRPFYFESIDSDTEYYREYRQMYMDQYENCDCIMIASPTGGYQMGTSSGIQEVQVERVLRGDQSLKGNTAWIDGMPGLAYYEDEDKTRIDALLNYMQEGNEYLIFCEPYISDEGEVIEMEEEYYHTDCFFGYLNITKRKDTGVILDINKSYTYEELEGYEFFGGCQSVLDVKREIKDALLEKYLKE